MSFSEDLLLMLASQITIEEFMDRCSGKPKKKDKNDQFQFSRRVKKIVNDPSNFEKRPSWTRHFKDTRVMIALFVLIVVIVLV